jgi:hypothetical protein
VGGLAANDQLLIKTRLLGIRKANSQPGSTESYGTIDRITLRTGWPYP